MQMGRPELKVSCSNGQNNWQRVFLGDSRTKSAVYKAENKADITYARLRMIFGAIPNSIASDIKFATVLMTSTLFRTPRKGVAAF